MRDVIACMASMARNRARRAVTRGQEAEAVDDLDAAAKKLAAPDRTIAQASRHFDEPGDTGPLCTNDRFTWMRK
ncbi:hypothetical protein A5779_21230 [Mycolicibacterium peregrinum]|uniref:Uncharacterized protein n=1 Tax=Mycolicibacterium peregrinum TaxID=43304 RepID=A0A1A0W978_MYCPR|nr:hypothetical protein A5779_21230 [Mycolicibacterium peregrinum]